MSGRDRVACPGESSLGCFGNRIVLLSHVPQTLVVNVDGWPPTVSVLDETYVYPAAPSDAGLWVQVREGEEATAEYWFGFLAYGDSSPRRLEAPPMRPPLDAATTRTFLIEDMLAIGDELLAVPVDAGYDGRAFPWLYSGGTWHELSTLPRYEAHEEHQRPLLKCVRLGDGAIVVIWDRSAFERRGSAFVRSFEHRIDAPWYRDWEPIPAGEDGFFYFSTDSRVLEIHRGAEAPVPHLQGLNVSGIWPGPDGAILVNTYDDLVLYDPRTESVAVLDREVVKDGHRDFLHWTDAGLVLRRSSPAAFDLYRAEAIAALPRTPASEWLAQVEAEQVEEPASALEGMLSSSRPRAATRGDEIAIAAGHTLRVHTVDAPEWRIDIGAEIVGVVGVPGGFATLDVEGVLRVHVGRDSLGYEAHIAQHPRSIAASPSGTIAVLALGGVHVVEQGAVVRVPFEAPIAAAFDAVGRLLVSGERRRVALISVAGGEAALRLLSDPPDDVRALAAAPDGTWLALAGSSLLSLDPAFAQWSTLSSGENGALLAVAPTGNRYALTSGPRHVSVYARDASKPELVVSYPEKYSQPEEPLSVTGLAFLDNGYVVAALDHGLANLYAGEQALKLDQWPDDPHARWIFIYDGKILIAD